MIAATPQTMTVAVPSELPVPPPEDFPGILGDGYELLYGKAFPSFGHIRG